MAIASTFSEDSLCAAGGTFESVTGTGVSASSREGELVEVVSVEARALALEVSAVAVEAFALAERNAAEAAPAGAAGSASAATAASAATTVRRIARE